MPQDRVAEFLATCADAATAIPPRLTRGGNPAEGPTEAQLETALNEAYVARGTPAHLLGARKLRIRDDWDPLPGPLDFCVRSSEGCELALVAELKFDDVEQRLWDLLKVLAARRMPGSPVALLVHGAPRSDWAKNRPCSELFPRQEQSVTLDTRVLFNRNRVQWARDLAYSGRPTTAPALVRCTGLLAGLRLPAYSTYELRVARVEAAGNERLRFVSGWPEG